MTREPLDPGRVRVAVVGDARTTRALVEAFATVQVEAFAARRGGEIAAHDVWLDDGEGSGPEGGAASVVWVGLVSSDDGAVRERTEALLRRGVDDVLWWPQPPAALEVAVARWSQMRRTLDVRRLPADHVRALKRLVELSSDAVEVTDTSVRLVHVNPSFEAVTGYTLSEVLGRTSGELFRANTHDPEFYHGIMRALRKDGVWRGSMIGRRRDGSLSIQEAILGAVFDPRQEIVGYVALKRDVHRDALTRALQAGVEGRITKAVEASAGAFVVHTDDGSVLEANGSAQALFGVDGARRSWSLLMDMDTVDARALREGWRDLAEGDTLEMEGRVRHQDGDLLHVVLRTRRMVVAGELFLVSLVLDTTAHHHRREIALARAREESLVEASEVLTRSLQEKEMLLKEVYHRVKNNLQIISSLLHLQGDGLDDPHARSSLVESANRVRSMALVHQQLYSGSSLAHVELIAYVRDLGQALAASCSGRLALDVDGAQVEVPLDVAVPCGLVLNELLTNAIKHGGRPGGGCEVQVRIARSSSNVTLTVHDRGPGFPSDFSVQRSSTLGWSLVRSLARQLRAEVTWANEDGARVRFAIPVRVLDE